MKGKKPIYISRHIWKTVFNVVKNLLNHIIYKIDINVKLKMAENTKFFHLIIFQQFIIFYRNR